MTIVIRRPVHADLVQLRTCLQTYHLHLLGQTDIVDRDFSEETILSVRNTICSVDLAEKCWIAMSEERVVGFCCWDWLARERQSAKTILISVLPEARSEGVGSLLQQKRLDEMQEQGAQEVHTWSDDPDSIRWYRERFGYELIGYEPIYHCLHRFSLGEHTFWGIHRGFPERSELAHLRRAL